MFDVAEATYRNGFSDFIMSTGPRYCGAGISGEFALSRFLPENAGNIDARELTEPVYRDLAIPLSRSSTEPSTVFIAKAPPYYSSPTPQARAESASWVETDIGKFNSATNEKSGGKVCPPTVPALFALEQSRFKMKNVDVSKSLKVVLSALRSFNVRHPSMQCYFEVNNIEFKIRGIVHSGFTNVDFRVRIYSSSDALPLVEFQRRSGDLLLWRHFYTVARADIIGTKPTGIHRVPKMVMDMSDNDDFTQGGADEIQPIVDLLHSEYSDMQLEGVCAIGQMVVQMNESILTQLMPKIIPYIVALVSADDSEIRCASVSVLATVCSKLQQRDGPAAEQLLNQAMCPLVTALKFEQQSYTTAHIRRECVRAISAASHRKGCSESIVRAGGITELQRCMWDADVSVKLFAQTALGNLTPLVVCR